MTDETKPKQRKKRTRPKGAPPTLSDMPRGTRAKGHVESEAIEGEVIPAVGGLHRQRGSRHKAPDSVTKSVTEATMEALGTRNLVNSSNAAYLGLAQPTFYKMLADRPELKLALQRGRAKVMAKVSNVVLAAALKGNMYAAMKILGLYGGLRDPAMGVRDDEDMDPATIIDGGGRGGAGGPPAQRTGVLLLPADVASLEDWEKKAVAHVAATKPGPQPPVSGGAPAAPPLGSVGSTGR